ESAVGVDAGGGEEVSGGDRVVLDDGPVDELQVAVPTGAQRRVSAVCLASPVEVVGDAVPVRASDGPVGQHDGELDVGGDQSEGGGGVVGVDRGVVAQEREVFDSHRIEVSST